MKKKLFIAIMVMLSARAFANGNNAQDLGGVMPAAIDNAITINLDATVTRACKVDFNSNTETTLQESYSVNNIKIQRKFREEPGTTSATVHFYVTCNEDYRLSLMSSSGGLKDQGNQSTGRNASARTVAYKVEGAGMSLTSSTDISSGGVSSGPSSQTLQPGPSTEVASEKVLTLHFDDEHDLPSGSYTDILTISMDTIQ